jgi:type IV pilus assembly protein PilN
MQASPVRSRGLVRSMRISLNLASRPFTDLSQVLKRLRIAMGVLAVLSIVFGFGLHLFDRQAAAARAREHSLDGEIARVQADRQQAQDLMRLPANAQLLDQAQTVNQIFDAKAFSWTLAMEAMETVLPAGVQVTAIEPARAKDGHITVHLRVAGGHDRAVELVRNLEHSRRFLQPRIVNESAETNNAPNQRPEPVSASNRFDFDLFADYNPPTPEERISVRNASRNSAALSPAAGTLHSRGATRFPRDSVRQPYTGPWPTQPGANPAFYRNPGQVPPNRGSNRDSGGPQ